MNEWLYDITNLDANNSLVFIVIVWPALIFFGLLQYLRTSKQAQPSPKFLIILYVLLGGLIPILLVTFSAFLHPRLWKWLPFAYFLIIFMLMFWSGIFTTSILKCYLGKEKFNQLISVNNETVTKQYPKDMLPLYLFSYCFLGGLLVGFLVLGFVALIPFLYDHDHLVGMIIAATFLVMSMLAYLLRWLLRCPLCNLAIFDYARNSDNPSGIFLSNSFSVIFKHKVKCSNCKATFLLRKKHQQG